MSATLRERRAMGSIKQQKNGKIAKITRGKGFASVRRRIFSQTRIDISFYLLDFAGLGLTHSRELILVMFNLITRARLSSSART